MVKQQTTYRSADGREFDNAEDAEKHERLVTAKRAYEDARHSYMRALADTFKTKDGLPFSLTGLQTYYRVLATGYQPRLEEISFYVWHCDIDERDEAGIWFQPEGRDRKFFYRIGDLYADKKNAQKALLEAWEEYLEQAQQDYEDQKRISGID